MIANLIGQLTSEIGISDTQANTAVGGILNLLKEIWISISMFR